MICVRYTLSCTQCNRREYDEGHDDETDLLLDAHRAGWRREKVPNGSMWDYCPECVARNKLNKSNN